MCYNFTNYLTCTSRDVHILNWSCVSLPRSSFSDLTWLSKVEDTLYHHCFGDIFITFTQTNISKILNILCAINLFILWIRAVGTTEYIFSFQSLKRRTFFSIKLYFHFSFMKSVQCKLSNCRKRSFPHLNYILKLSRSGNNWHKVFLKNSWFVASIVEYQL